MSNLLPESMLAEIRARAEAVPMEPPFSHGAFAIADRRKLLAHIEACSPGGASAATDRIRDLDVLGLANQAGFSMTQINAMFRDVGPYDITEPRPAFRAFVDLLVARCSSGGAEVNPLTVQEFVRADDATRERIGEGIARRAFARQSPEPSEKPKEWHDEQAISHSLDCSTWKQLRQLVDEKRHALRTEQEMHAAWRKRATEAEAELQALKSSGEPPGDPLDYKLPCEVRLPPATTFGVGVSLRTVVHALQRRTDQYPPKFSESPDLSAVTSPFQRPGLIGYSSGEPDEKARLMEYAVAAGDCIVAGVPQWRDGWAIISRIQTDPPNERWMLHDADEREKESRAEAVQLALVNTGMDFAVVPIKWRTPTKDDKQ